MCAIAGIIGIPYDDEIIEKMKDTMRLRGPDSEGSLLQEHYALLHCRLAVIDPEGGTQPMTAAVGEEEYTIIYNGELYNTYEIREKLIGLHHCFKTHSDTEVVLHAYMEWKEHLLEYLNGIFAFAVMEHHSGRVFIARDRIGVKPLFYTIHNNGLIFASEIKTILQYPTVKAELDADGAAEILLLGPGRTPGNGVFKGILELEPGCYGIFQNHTWHWHRYWKLRDQEHTDSFEQTAEYIRYLMIDSIRRQMISDVPIGAFLSGGLDSSLICAVCASEMKDKGEQLQTFSLDFYNNSTHFVAGKFQHDTDNRYIQFMAEEIQSKHHWTVLTPEDLLTELENATVARDLPGMADVDFSLLVLCRNLRKYVKVALSGECADEIFGGYPWYRDPEVLMQNGFPWAQNTNYRASFLSEYIRDKISPNAYVRDRYNQTIADCDILPGNSIQEIKMKQMVNLNHRWFMQTLLDRKDRMSMFSGLEVRVPFCDHRIAEYLYSVPWKYKDYNGIEKGLLRYAMQGILPDKILYRKKNPYPKTYDPKYFELVSERLTTIVEDPQAPIHQIVSKNALNDLLNAEYLWPWYGQLMKVPQTIAYMLQINFWMENYNISVV